MNEIFIYNITLFFTMDKEILTKAGLTNRESEAYLALLQLREALVSEISKKTKENRTHLYDTLNSLIEKGLVSYVIKGGKKYFRPAPPEKLIEYLQEKQKLIEKYLPELNQLYKPKIKVPIVEVFEGKEGIKTVLRDVLRENKEWLCLGSTGKSKELIPFFLEQWHKQRVKQKMPLRVIYNDDKFGRARGKEVEKQKYTKQRYTKVKYMPKTSPTTTYIYGEKVIIIIWEKEKLVAIMIKDKDVAESFKSYFETVWKVARK